VKFRFPLTLLAIIRQQSELWHAWAVTPARLQRLMTCFAHACAIVPDCLDAMLNRKHNCKSSPKHHCQMLTDWFLNRDVIPDGTWADACPSEPEVHGSFIRTLTRENFTTWWSQLAGMSRYQQEPRFPERYKMVQTSSETIGFLSTRCRWLSLPETIQLLPAWRGRGYGNSLTPTYWKVALSRVWARYAARIWAEPSSISISKSWIHTAIGGWVQFDVDGEDTVKACPWSRLTAARPCWIETAHKWTNTNVLATCLQNSRGYCPWLHYWYIRLSAVSSL